MANKNLFKSASSLPATAPVAETVNRAGGAAYLLADEAALAQFAMTGTFNNTFYATSETQLTEAMALANKVRPEFLAKLAVYSREKGLMKDMPAMLLAVLCKRDIELFKKTFSRVVDNGKMLRNFMQIVRSGVVGRKSFGSAPKRAIRKWIEARTDEQLFHDSVGNDPAMADIIKMVHPRPRDEERARLYAYLIGKTPEVMPKAVAEFEAFKKTAKGDRKVPNVPFQMLTALELSDKEWTEIAKNARWQMTRMNLNTFLRHGVLKDEKMVKMLAERLVNEKDIKGAKAFPYQLMAAYLNVDGEMPRALSNALQDALEVATQNVPRYKGKVYVCVDISGSMSSAITGNRPGSTSKVRCVEVAGLIASCVLRNCDNAEVIPFHTTAVVANDLNARDSVMTNAQKIFNRPSGGTDCSCALKLLNAKKAQGDLVIYVSDNESWVSGAYAGRGTAMQQEWLNFKSRNRNAKLVCIDLQASSTAQAKNSVDTLNVGGFSDQVFEVIQNFLESTGNPDFWTRKIESEVTL